MKQLNQAQTLAVNGAGCNSDWAPVGIPGIIIGAGIGFALPHKATIVTVFVSVNAAILLAAVSPTECVSPIVKFTMTMGTTALFPAFAKIALSHN